MTEPPEPKVIVGIVTEVDPQEHRAIVWLEGEDIGFVVEDHHPDVHTTARGLRTGERVMLSYTEPGEGLRVVSVVEKDPADAEA